MKIAARPKAARLATLLASLIAGIALGFLGGYALGQFQIASLKSSLSKALAPVDEGGADYQFIQPLIAYRTPEATSLGDYTGLDSTLENLITTATNDGDATRISVYFRDLDASEWLGINQNDTYYPASLLKVPVMIAYYKEAETDPTVFDRAITYETSMLPPASDDPFDVPSALTPGKSYTVSYLINQMVTNSDNGATFALLSQLNADYLNEVYTGLGIPNPGDDSTNYQISTATYAFFFRILYNATYLSAASSEAAMQLLSQSTFTAGLAAGVPTSTPIAHKFGEHVLSSGNTVIGLELSDCGVTYYPAHPYLLCVMTSSPSLTQAENIIATISSATYSAVDARYATSTVQ